MHGIDGELLVEDTPQRAEGGSERKEYVYVHGRQIAVETTTKVGTTTVLEHIEAVHASEMAGSPATPSPGTQLPRCSCCVGAPVLKA
jgi:hypothetical protein